MTFCRCFCRVRCIWYQHCLPSIEVSPIFQVVVGVIAIALVLYSRTSLRIRQLRLQIKQHLITAATTIRVFWSEASKTENYVHICVIPRIDNCRYKRLLTSREASMSSIAERQILRHTSSGCLYIVQGIKCCSNFSLFHPWAPLLCARLVNMSDFSPWKMVFYPVNLGYLFYVKCSNCHFLAETFGSILRNVDCPPNGTGDRLGPAPSSLRR